MAARRPCYDKALDLLARRPHFRRELARKLGQRGYGENEIDAALERLAARSWLDDRQVAKAFVEGRLARQPEGRRRLMAELVRRGADGELAEEVLDALLPGDDLELARAAAHRWAVRGRSGDAALARHLERRGFTRRAILAVLRDAGHRATGADGDGF